MAETKSNINWFPGHMAKARREMTENLKNVDMVIEIRDSRIPSSSQNPLLNEITSSKPRLIVLSKKDKAEDEATESWIRYFKEQGFSAIALDLINDRNISKKISEACKQVMKVKIEKMMARGLKHYEVKAMVAGIPNVGKSTLINAVANKKAAKTADHPGVTKNLQWIKISQDVALLDTPGVLWPKFEDQKTGMLLAVTGAINDNILPIDQVCHFAIEYLSAHHCDLISKRYDIDAASEADEIIKQICISRGALLTDGSPDYKRGYAIILKDIRNNMLGKISWEKPDEN